MRAIKARDALDTSISFSQHSAHITTSVVGLAVLVISLVFFFLFLQNVYEVKQVNINQAPIGRVLGASL